MSKDDRSTVQVIDVVRKAREEAARLSASRRPIIIPPTTIVQKAKALGAVLRAAEQLRQDRFNEERRLEQQRMNTTVLDVVRKARVDAAASGRAKKGNA